MNATWRLLLAGAVSLGCRVDIAAAEPTRWAILVGVDDYTNLRDLQFAGNDQRALAKELVERMDYPADQVFLLHDRAKESKYRPYHSNVEEQLSLVLDLVEEGDTVLFAFSGHGVHLDEASYLCPADARMSKPAE